MSSVKFKAQSDLGQDQPMIGHMFQVKIGSDTFGNFTNVSGISYSIEPYEIEEGGRNHSPHIRGFSKPGRRGELVLKWGSVKRDILFAWMELVQVGAEFRRAVSLYHLNRKGDVYREMTLLGCWPKEWKGADMDSNSTEIATEEITLVYEDLKLKVFPNV